MPEFLLQGDVMSADAIGVMGLVFTAVTLVGFYCAYLYGRKTKQFRWIEYGAILIVPVLLVFYMSYLISIKVLHLFFISSFVGFGLEYIIGLTYHKTLNKRLWTYDRLSVGGYTSLLSIPIWGVAGIVFWSLSKIVGL